MKSEIIEFYEGNPNKNGDLLEDIWNFNKIQLEGIHSYVQYLFPITEPSYFNRASPKLTDEDISEFKSNYYLKIKLCTSFIKMLRFWGFDVILDDEKVTITRSKDFDVNSAKWLAPKDHNHLRMTRVLHCMNTLGLPECAEAFYDALMQVNKDYPNIIKPRRPSVRLLLRFWYIRCSGRKER